MHSRGLPYVPLLFELRMVLTSWALFVFKDAVNPGTYLGYTYSLDTYSNDVYMFLCCSYCAVVSIGILLIGRFLPPKGDGGVGTGGETIKIDNDNRKTWPTIRVCM